VLTLIPTHQFQKLTAHINCEKNGGLFWGVVLVFAKQCSTQATDTSLRVDIVWKIIPYFASVDFPLFTIKIKSKTFRDRIAPHHWQQFRARYPSWSKALSRYFPHSLP
jgi:hypothetical protein